MARRSGIEWTEMTWNPVTGCDRVSPGCDNCYALSMARRLKGMGSARYQTDGNPITSGPGFGLQLHEDLVRLPLTWKSPRTVFVNSMSDLFHAKVPFEFIDALFETMRDTPQHTYQILTKRSLRLSRLATRIEWPENVWVGVSVENADHLYRVAHLRDVPAQIRFLSCEPLLGSLSGIDLSNIDWVIAGGESGPHYRPVEVAWARSIRDAARQAKVPFFFKQWGGRTPKGLGRELDGRVWDEMPIRQAG